MALVVGGDCHEKPGKNDRMFKLNSKMTNILNEKGYDVYNVYGNSKDRAQDFVNANSGAHVKPVSMESIKSYLDNAYAAGCEARPDKLMLNFVTHGMHNNGKHSLCPGVDDNGNIEHLEVSKIASHLKKLQNFDPNCKRPVVTIIDHSCKSGGSISPFEGLGCTITAAGVDTKSSDDFTNQIMDNISNSNGKSMSDLHMDILLNRDYSLYDTHYVGDVHKNDEKIKNDKSLSSLRNGDYYLHRHFKNSNQVSGCYDEIGNNSQEISPDRKKGKFNFVPICQNSIGILEKKRELEFENIEQIIANYNLKAGLDKQAIAKSMGVDPSKVTDADKISSKIDEVLKDDKSQMKKISPLLQEESDLLSDSDLNKSTGCRLVGPIKPNAKFSSKDKSSFSKLAKYPKGDFLVRRKNMMKAMCDLIYDKGSRAHGNCSVGFKTSTFKIKQADIIRLQKDINLLDDNFIQHKMKTDLEMSKNQTQIGLNSEPLLEIFKSTVASCFNRLKKNSNPVVSAAANFVAKNYKKSKASCKDGSISCHMAHARAREKEVKKNFAMARAYFFLRCKQSFNKNDDLKSCDQFKI